MYGKKQARPEPLGTAYIKKDLVVKNGKNKGSKITALNVTITEAQLSRLPVKNGQVKLTGILQPAKDKETGEIIPNSFYVYLNEDTFTPKSSSKAPAAARSQAPAAEEEDDGAMPF